MDETQIRAACPKCVRLVACESESEAKDVMKSHNVGQHNGDDVAFVMNETVEEMAEFFNKVNEMATEEEYGNFRTGLAKGTGEVSLVAKEFTEINKLVDHETHQFRY